MAKKLIFSAMLMIAIVLLISIPLNSVSYAQDATATPIPILADSTEDSAAPLAPDIAPPVVDDTTTDTAVEPEATEAVGVDSGVSIEAPANIGPVCPVSIENSFTATEILCADMTSGEACLGNGTVDSTFGADVAGSFSQANDRVQLTSLDQLTLTSGSTWTVIRAELELATTDGGDIATATMIAYGNLTLTDTGRVAAGGARNGTVAANRGMNVRRTPGNDGVVVWQLQGGQEIIVTGISADREWIRIIIPNDFAGTGWVYAPYVTVEGGDETLAVVTVNSPQPDFSTPEFAPGQSFELLSALPSTDLKCDETVPVSGLLIQSPSGTPDSLKIKINSAEIQFNGTIFVQAQAGEALVISVLEGQSTVIFNGSQATASANNRVNVSLDNNLVVNGSPQAEAFNASDLPSVPTRILQRQVSFDMTPIDEVPAEDTTSDAGFGTPVATSVPETCTLTAPDEVRNVRAGASTEFEVVQVLQPSDSVMGVGQAIGELNLTWYQTEAGGWIRIDTIEASSGCSAVPVVEAPPLPNPTEAPATTQGLQSSTLAELICDGTAITGSITSDGTDTSVVIGGTWTASAGTNATFTTQGGMLRPEFGDLIRLVASDGTILAGSEDGPSLVFTFDTDTTFEAHFSAANGDLVVMAASCN